MRLSARICSPALLAFCLVGPGACDDAKKSSSADSAAKTATKSGAAAGDAPKGDDADAQPEPDPLVVEAVDATKADIAEVRKGLSEGSMAESMVCSDIHRRIPTVEKADPELAAEAKKVCDYERPLAELEMTVKAVETEVAENPAKPGRKRMIVACTTATPKQARKTMEDAKTLDDKAEKLLARFDELCAS